MSVSDPYASTVYRDLANAEEAVGLARFYGSEISICNDHALAVEQIDAAIVALTTARERISG